MRIKLGRDERIVGVTSTGTGRFVFVATDWRVVAYDQIQKSFELIVGRQYTADGQAYLVGKGEMLEPD